LPGVGLRNEWVAKVDNVFVLKEITIVNEVKKTASKINEEGTCHGSGPQLQLPEHCKHRIADFKHE
jgi:hypothetical protein